MPERALVVGAGAAGCVVAARLAEAGVATVLIEAGTAGVDRVGHATPGLLDPSEHSERFWPPIQQSRITSAPRSELTDYWMGRGLGGGSAVNAMLISGGDEADYDRWSTMGDCSDWSAEKVRPWLEKALAILRPEKQHVEPDMLDLISAFDEGFAPVGIGPAGTTLDEGRTGLFTPVLATKDGRRRSVADAYLRLGDANLTIWTGCEVVSLVVEGRAAKGVVLADGEVVLGSMIVLTAGTIGTARLLHNTGVRRHVGGWIKNHEAASIPFRWPATFGPLQPPGVHRVARWSSMVASEPVVGAAQPDLSALLIGPFAGPSGPTGIVEVMTSNVCSSGWIDLAGARPRLISNRLSDPDDRTRLRHGVRAGAAAVRHILEMVGGQGFLDKTGAPAALDQLRDDDLDDWLIENPGPVYHAVGSCRMGDDPDKGPVASASRGEAGTIAELDGAVVADASVFPDLVAGGLQLPVMAVAERIAAETLLAHW